MNSILKLQRLKKHREESGDEPLFSEVTAEIIEPDMIALHSVSGQD